MPTEITVDVEVTLASQFEASVSVGANLERPFQHRQLDSRAVRGETQQFTFVIEVVPVDWGERGQFSIDANLLPPPAGPGPIARLAHDATEVEVVP